MKRAIGIVIFLLVARATGAQIEVKDSGQSATTTVTAASATVMPQSEQGPTDTKGSGPVVIRLNSKDAEEETAKPSSSVRPVAKAPEPPTDFEQFVQTALGHSLPVFGRGLFRGGSSSFAPSTSITVPSDYVIGPGDELLIRAWGKIDIDLQLTVDRNGQIFIPRVGTLTVAGLRMDQLTEFIHSAIAQQFRDFDLTVTLGRLRSIQIFVLGQASQPGVYTISSLSTLVNALFDSGGPSYIGTLRDIQVKRDGKVITHFDVYRLLLAGDKSADIHLLPGDIIYIPQAGPQVAVDGDVNTPAIYELHGNTTLASLLDDASGLTVLGGTARVVLEHIVDHEKRTIDDFPLDTSGMGKTLNDGDILRILPISPKIENGVTLSGSVASPGIYAWHSGMRISDLIPNRDFLLTRAYYNGQNAIAGRGTSAPDISNHVTELDWNYAVIQRLSKDDLTTKLIPFALGQAIADPGSIENKELEPGDVVVIYSQSDLTLPQALQAKFVTIEGQVMAPGTYRVGDGETLRSLVQRAGGFAPHAYLYASELTRTSVLAEQVKKLRQLEEQESEEVLSPSNTGPSKIAGLTTTDTSGDLDLRRAYIARLNDVHPTGRIVLRLRPEANGIQDVPDFVLEDGDHFTVPVVPNTVEVLGNVYNQGAMRYAPHQQFRRYLNTAGGPNREADKKREFVIRADGTIVSRQQISDIDRTIIYPGDVVVVPPKLKSPTAFDINAFAQLLSSLALGFAAIKTLQ